MLPPILLIESATSKLRRDERSHNRSGIVKKERATGCCYFMNATVEDASSAGTSWCRCAFRFDCCMVGNHRSTITTIARSPSQCDHLLLLSFVCVNEDYVFIHGKRSGSRGQWWKVLGSGGSG
ncbi:hypothetical protein PIB30_018134 [Stylosanthes scabra]|uniref:Uncharacterized protein n=1 Tax=Stylosanthes scabra TaxID=79078 RepID=A0ABU6Q8P3_9FABA|nr:hypothetical protein [Stylosanthes scabra]